LNQLDRGRVVEDVFLDEVPVRESVAQYPNGGQDDEEEEENDDEAQPAVPEVTAVDPY
jgi:hypothetical protein